MVSITSFVNGNGLKSEVIASILEFVSGAGVMAISTSMISSWNEKHRSVNVKNNAPNDNIERTLSIRAGVVLEKLRKYASTVVPVFGRCRTSRNISALRAFRYLDNAYMVGQSDSVLTNVDHVIPDFTLDMSPLELCFVIYYNIFCITTTSFLCYKRKENLFHKKKKVCNMYRSSKQYKRE